MSGLILIIVNIMQNMDSNINNMTEYVTTTTYGVLLLDVDGALGIICSPES